MCCTDQNDAEIHPEVEDLEYLCFCKSKYHYTSKFGQGDAGKYL